MPCIPLPSDYFPTPPALPGGFGIPAFTPPSITAGRCCNIQVPPWGPIPVPLPPFPPATVAAVVALLAQVDEALAEVFDAVAVPCPIE